MNFFEEAGSPEGPPPAIPEGQPSAPAIPPSFTPPPGPVRIEPDHVPTWADTDKELPPFFEEPAVPQPRAAEPPPAPAVAAQPPAAPQAPYVDPNAIGQQIVQGLLGAAQAREQQAAFEQNATAAMAIPELDTDRWAVDPVYQRWYLDQRDAAMQRRTLAMVAPAFNQAAAMARVGPAVIEAQINTARSVGSQLAKERLGMDVRRYQELVPVIHRLIDENPDGAARLRFLTNPEAWVTGAEFAHRAVAGGVPVQPSAPPPSLGGGGGAPAGSGAGAFRGKTAMMNLVEQQLGRKLFRPEHVEQLRHNLAIGGTREPRSA
jgi:hypothetical protein